MALKNCERCGRTMETGQSSATVCPDCLMKDGVDLGKVTLYLRKNPLASVAQVCKDTGVPFSTVNRLIDKGTLKISNRPNSSVCRFCGKPAKDSVCPSCREKLKDSGIIK